MGKPRKTALERKLEKYRKQHEPHPETVRKFSWGLGDLIVTKLPGRSPADADCKRQDERGENCDGGGTPRCSRFRWTKAGLDVRDLCAMEGCGNSPEVEVACQHGKQPTRFCRQHFEAWLSEDPSRASAVVRPVVREGPEGGAGKPE